MGTWGAGWFENDTALDWTGELVRGAGTDLLEATLRQVFDAGGYPEAPACDEAIAAAAVVAQWRAASTEGLPADVVAWIPPTPPSPALVALAERAVSQVVRSSELRDLWREGGAEGWERGVEVLLARLRTR